ncbi:hypothetical protein CTI12_AA168440 [Artemisia annua]|uniref:DUF659 domain-containing protein n=1 Tax=Artemisia annua TaxID=35608 RepID=A0A2U1PCD8_ARTAN|nr:hypothetical protein CTI12_AA168440 [Artemisia annua]
MASPVSSIPKRPSPSQVTSYDDKPLWNHVTVVQNPGSYAKVKAHLLKLPGHGVQPCMKINYEIKDQIQKEHAMAEDKKAQVSFEAKRKLDYVTLPPCSDLMQPKRKKRENSMFLKAFDTSGNLKDADYVASLFQEVIDEEGADNIVQIITDSSRNFKATGFCIEAKYPHIFWTPCVVHSLNLALKAICEPPINSSQYDECKWISSLMSECDAVVTFILNHGKALTIFKNYSKHMLTKVAETRFASHVIMAERLFKVKNALEKMVLDVQWKTFRKTHLESKADTVKECVISN